MQAAGQKLTKMTLELYDSIIQVPSHPPRHEVAVFGSGFGVEGSEFRFLRVWGLGSWVYGLGFRV